MGNGTKFKLSSMFPSVLSKIKGITGKKPKGKGSLTIPSDWSDEMPDFSTASKDSPCSPPSPVRTFPQSREREMRFCSSPHCSSPINHNKSYDIRFPTESPLRRGMKSRPVSPPRRSANSTDSGCCSFDSTLPQDRIRRAMPPLFGRCVHHQQQQQPRSSKCNSYNSDTHSDSELDITDSEPQSTTSRSHLRARTMSLQLDGTTEWERERERERDWSEPEKSASSSSRRRRPRDSPMSKKISTAGEPSPILHTVRCMPPNIIPTNFSDHHHHHPHPDYMSRDQNASSLPRFDRKLSFTTDDNRLFEDNYTSFSSDEDFFKVRSSTNGGGAKANGNGIGQYRLKNLTSYGTSELDLTETEDRKRSFRRETVLAKTVLNASAAAAAGSDGWARVQSRFADEEKHAQLQHQHQQQQQQLLQQTMMRMGRVSYDRKATAAAGDESELLLTEDERLHVAMCRREASLVKTVLSAKDWARENLRALSKASELEKQAKQQLRGTTTTEESMVEYESFGLPVIHKEHVQQSRGSSRTHSPVVVVGEVEEKHTKGRIDYQSSPNDHHHHHHYPDQGSDNLVYEQFSQPLAEYASDFYKNAQTEESDFETNGGSRTWEVEFPSFRSDRGSRRSGPVELLLESERLTPRNHKYSGQERSARTPKKQNLTSNSTASATTTAREVLGRKFNRSASSPKVQDLPVNSMKPSSRSGSPRKQEPLVHTSSSGGKRATSPRTAGPPSSIRQETVSKKISRSQSPRRQEVSGKTASSNSLSPVQQQDVSGNKVVNNKVSGRSVSPAQSSPDSKKKKKGNTRATSNQSRPQEERASVMGSDSVAVVKSSYDPYQDFRESMVEMILENDIQTAEDLEELLQCYLSLNSAEYHSIIVQVFSDIWRDIFDH